MKGLEKTWKDLKGKDMKEPDRNLKDLKAFESIGGTWKERTWKDMKILERTWKDMERLEGTWKELEGPKRTWKELKEFKEL